MVLFWLAHDLLYNPVIMRLFTVHFTLWDCRYICIVILYNVDVIRLVGRKLLWSWDKHNLWLSHSYLVLRNKISLCHWPTRKLWVLNWSRELRNNIFLNMYLSVYYNYLYFYVVDLTSDAGWCVSFFKGEVYVYWLIWSGGIGGLLWGVGVAWAYIH